jgi:hypothetical protein
VSSDWRDRTARGLDLATAAAAPERFQADRKQSARHIRLSARAFLSACLVPVRLKVRQMVVIPPAAIMG